MGTLREKKRGGLACVSIESYDFYPYQNLGEGKSGIFTCALISTTLKMPHAVSFIFYGPPTVDPPPPTGGTPAHWRYPPGAHRRFPPPPGARSHRCNKLRTTQLRRAFIHMGILREKKRGGLACVSIES